MHLKLIHAKPCSAYQRQYTIFARRSETYAEEDDETDNAKAMVKIVCPIHTLSYIKTMVELQIP